MRKVTAYNVLTLNGFFKSPQDDIRWHVHGEEEEQYSIDSLQHGHILLFGRRTWEMMASFWPTPMAAEQSPEVAVGMNRAEKIVFTRTPFPPAWSHTRVVSGDIVGEIRALKATPGPSMTILGSGSIVSLFAGHGLIDEFEFMIDPVAIPDGTPAFAGIPGPLALELTGSRVFRSGTVLLTYRPRRGESPS